MARLAGNTGDERSGERTTLSPCGGGGRLSGSSARPQHDETDQDIDACELIARLLAHLPDPRKHLVFYFGAYSNVARARRKKADVSLGVAGDTEPDETSSVTKILDHIRHRVGRAPQPLPSAVLA